MSNKFNYIDLFSGIGGFKYVLDSIGGRCLLSSEINMPAINTYSENHKNINYETGWDMEKLVSLTKRKMYSLIGEKKKVDVISAGFPCQTFSVAGKRRGFNQNDTRGTQFFNIIKLIQIFKPQIILLENVKHLLKHDEGKTYRVIIENLENEGYDISFSEILSPMQIGIPQNRDRIFIVATNKKNKQKLSKIELDIYDLKKNKFDTNDKGNKKILDNSDNRGIRIKEDQLKAIKAWEEFVLKWFKHRNELEKTIPALWLEEMRKSSFSKREKSSFPEWKIDMIEKMQSFYYSHKEWIDKWFSKYDKTLVKRIHRKLEWNAGIEFKPKETIAVIRQSGVRFKKPNYYPTLVAVVDIPIIFDKNKWRNINFQEMKNLQSFPEEFKKPKNVTFEEIYKQLGNSINIELAKRVVMTFEHFFRNP